MMRPEDDDAGEAIEPPEDPRELDAADAVDRWLDDVADGIDC